MDIKEIQALIKFVASQGVDEVCIERKDFKLSIKKADKFGPVNSQFVAQQQSMAVAQMPVAPLVAIAAAPAAVPAVSNLIEVKSPMIGTFYRSASPESPLFVNIGDEIVEGKIVCIIEAMKLFNEIESEVSGRIVKVLVDNATPVEYGQPLFLVEPI